MYDDHTFEDQQSVLNIVYEDQCLDDESKFTKTQPTYWQFLLVRKVYCFWTYFKNKYLYEKQIQNDHNF
jgi:hypothetical protein